LALLPFEPQAHARLGGPRCVYVGHPLVERLDELTPHSRDRDGARSLLILPGSRLAEVRRMTPIYGETLELLLRERADFDVVIPVAPFMEQAVRHEWREWPMTPRLIGQAEKFAAFRKARAALVTSGVATLELALAEVPMAVAYRVSRAESLLRFLVNVESIVLPNLVLGENIVPEFLQRQATPRALAEALRPLLGESAAREAQRAAFPRVRARLLEAGRSPSARAADIVLEYALRGRA
jgi:lipid-A-disaccharide synthase